MQVGGSRLSFQHLFGFWLTGKALTERTNASTTGLLSASTGEWNDDLVAWRLGCVARSSATSSTRARLGDITADICVANVPVVAVRSHDTASAVVAVPMTTPHAAYISCGTYGLVGVELDAPVLSEAPRDASFTNEDGSCVTGSKPRGALPGW